MKKILLIGGGGYVGTELAFSLAKNNYEVGIYDLFLFGKANFKKYRNIKCYRNDIRNIKSLIKVVKKHDVIIHLACISNDPSYDLNPILAKKINYESFIKLVNHCNKVDFDRFIYASSSSVYGIKHAKNVTEKLKLNPLTDYSKYKVLCEKKLHKSAKFNYVIIRPATVCGYSRRLRLDVVVNVLTAQAYINKKINIFGGKQLRPNIHIKDMVRCYEKLIKIKIDKINKKTFNAGYENLSVEKIAKKIKAKIPHKIKMNIIKSNDNRSYHISSAKIDKQINFRPKFSTGDAITDLIKHFKTNNKDLFKLKSFYNLKTIKSKQKNY